MLFAQHPLFLEGLPLPLCEAHGGLSILTWVARTRARPMTVLSWGCCSQPWTDMYRLTYAPLFLVFKNMI